MNAQDKQDFLRGGRRRERGNPILERIREDGAETLMALYRVCKNALVHKHTNDAVLRAVESATKQLSDFTNGISDAVTFTWLDDTVFICGQLMRASRKIYQAAQELGGYLARCGISQVRITPELEQEALHQFAVVFSEATRDVHSRGSLLAANLPGVEVRQVEWMLTQRENEKNLTPAEQITRLYAAALVVMKGYFDEIAHGRRTLPMRVKRVAQRLVTLAETGDPALLGMTTMAAAHRDDASRAVQSAIITLLVAHQLTDDRVALARLALCALIGDAGRAATLSVERRDQVGRLNEDEEERIPPMTGGIAAAAGGLDGFGALRATTVFEATWSEMADRLGPLHRGEMPPLLAGRLLHMARALVEALAPRDWSTARTPLEALGEVSRQPWVDPALFKLLVRALGLMPVGSVVVFETGEWGVVVGPSRNNRSPDRPRVRVITDRNGRCFESPREVDLGAPSAGRTYPRVARILSPNEARFNVVRVFTTA